MMLARVHSALAAVARGGAQRLLATAKKAGGPQKKRGQSVPEGPKKQTLMARKKAMVAASVHRRGDAPDAGPRAALVDALFRPEDESPLGPEGSARQLMDVHNAWRRTCMLALHERTRRERALVESRDRAILALRAVSPRLARAAEQTAAAMDPPVHRRMPALTPPDPSQLFITMAD